MVSLKNYVDVNRLKALLKLKFDESYTNTDIVFVATTLLEKLMEIDPEGVSKMLQKAKGFRKGEVKIEDFQAVVEDFLKRNCKGLEG